MPLPRPRPTVAALLLAFGSLCLAGVARAQSLQALYEAARGYDASFLAARAQLDSAQYRVEQTYAARRPRVDLQVAGSVSNTDSLTQRNTDSTSASAAVQASQWLFNRANDKTIEQAEKTLEASKADYEAAEQDLIVRVAQGYFDVLAAQDTLETIRTNKAATAEQLASAKRNFEVGTATITDTREAQARYDLVLAQEIAAENDLRTKRIALDQLVGRPDVKPVGLATPVALPTVVPAAPDDWVSTADAVHPTVRRARVAYEIAQLETEKARAGNLPTVALNGSLERGHQSSKGTGSSGLPFDVSGTAGGTRVGVTMSVPLFAGYAIQNRVKETLALEDKARNDLDAARRIVAQATRQAFFGVQSVTAQVKALEAAESSSQLALEATQLGYRVGVRVNLDVLNAQTQLFTTRRDLARARYDVLLGTLKLRQAAGQLKPQDVGAVDALLAK